MKMTFFLVLPVCCAPYSIARAQDQPPSLHATEVLSIKGAVTESATGLPVADLLLGAKGPGAVRQTTTDENGLYTFTDLPAGHWEVSTPQFGPFLPKTHRLHLLPGQTSATADLRLDKAAVLAGRVLYPDGTPVAGAAVHAGAYGYRDGRPTVISFRLSLANDRGEYRIAGLRPGRYVVSVEPKPLAIRTVATKNSKIDNEERPPVVSRIRTYYPNAPSFENAIPLNLSAGERREALDISLLSEKTYCVTARVARDASAIDAAQVSITISDLLPGSQSRIAQGNTAPDGTIDVCGLAPGSYRLWALARGADSGSHYYASEVFAVTNRPLILPTLYLRATQTLPGRVRIADAKEELPIPAGTHVFLRPKDRMNMAGESTHAQAGPAGAFVIPGVFLDDYWLHVRHPSGFYLKEASVSGRDALRRPFRAGSGELNIVLGSDGPSVTGQVKDRQGTPLPDVTVVLTAVPLRAERAPHDVLVKTSDKDGAFHFDGIPPGDYRIVAATAVTPTEAADPDILRRLSPKATSVTLMPRDAKSVTLNPLDSL